MCGCFASCAMCISAAFMRHWHACHFLRSESILLIVMGLYMRCLVALSWRIKMKVPIKSFQGSGSLSSCIFGHSNATFWNINSLDSVVPFITWRWYGSICICCGLPRLCTMYTWATLSLIELSCGAKKIMVDGSWLLECNQRRECWKVASVKLCAP